MSASGMTATLAPARSTAFQILQKIAADKGNSDALLHSEALQALSQLDRNLCTALVLGTLRWQIALDGVIRKHLSQPNVALADAVALALRLGAFQLLFMDRIPVHAVIFESVEWVKHSDNPRASGMVNAVLRKIAAQAKATAISSESAAPDWLVQRWRRNYGSTAVKKICTASQQEPTASIRLAHPDAEQELISEGVRLEPGALLAQARSVVAGDAFSTRAVLEGRAQFQDEGSQLVAELLGRGEKILDCCAAPGGKTAILLERNPEARIVACDVSAARLKLMQQRLERLEWRDRIEYRVADAAQTSEFGGFDRILCDVPCSGTGTLARNPEIRHRLRPEEISRQANRQRGILASALQKLAPGGRLLYATCSLEPEENEEVVRGVLKEKHSARDEFAMIDLHTEFQGLMQQGVFQGASVEHFLATAFRSGFLRTLPGVHPCDGFFAALIERK